MKASEFVDWGARVYQERQKALEALADAERRLRVAQRALVLVDGAINTGEMVIRQTDGSESRQRAASDGYYFSQAWSMADRLTR